MEDVKFCTVGWKTRSILHHASYTRMQQFHLTLKLYVCKTLSLLWSICALLSILELLHKNSDALYSTTRVSYRYMYDCPFSVVPFHRLSINPLAPGTVNL
jgi:hypothetical protein